MQKNQSHRADRNKKRMALVAMIKRAHRAGAQFRNFVVNYRDNAFTRHKVKSNPFAGLTNWQRRKAQEDIANGMTYNDAYAKWKDTPHWKQSIAG